MDEIADLLLPTEDYADEASFLWLQRAQAVTAPHYSPRQFAQLDDLLSAHLDGLQLEPGAGWPQCEALLATGLLSHNAFVAGVVAVKKPPRYLDEIIAMLPAAPEALPGLASALAWTPISSSTEAVDRLCTGESTLARKLGIAVVGMQRRDPGPTLDRALVSPSAGVRLRACRAAAEIGRADLLPAVLDAVEDANPELRYWSLWSACLLGERRLATAGLAELALQPGSRQLSALLLALQVMRPAEGHDLMRQLNHLQGHRRMRILGAGYAGEARYLHWLLAQMRDSAVARIAFEAFVAITGVDINAEQMEALPPEGFDDGPTEDPDDERIDLPQDIALPWPDVARVESWWSQHQAKYSAGTKLILGKPPTPDHCLDLLSRAPQRTRVHAAQLLCLTRQGHGLFPTAAPAWRQHRLLNEARMSM